MCSLQCLLAQWPPALGTVPIDLSEDLDLKQRLPEPLACAQSHWVITTQGGSCPRALQAPHGPGTCLGAAAVPPVGTTSGSSPPAWLCALDSPSWQGLEPHPPHLRTAGGEGGQWVVASLLLTPLQGRAVEKEASPVSDWHICIPPAEDRSSALGKTRFGFRMPRGT